MIKLNNTALSAIFNVATADAHAERATLAALPILRKAFAGQKREDIRDTIMVEYAHAVRITLTVQGTGRLVWPADAGTAKRACNRLINRVLGDETADKQDAPEVEVAPELLALARKMAKVSGMDRKACAKALALAFAK